MCVLIPTLLISGTVGVGKSTIAAGPNYRARGATHLVLARVLEDPDELVRYRTAVPGAQITICRLTASRTTRDRRLRARLLSGPSLDWHLQRTFELEDILERVQLEDFVVANDGRPARDVALDVEVMLAAGLDQLISRYRYSLPRTLDAARRWITATETDRLAGKRLELAITERGVPLGSIALAEVAHGNAMVRHWLLPDGRGHGLATAVVRLLAGWAFSTLGLGRLGAFIEIDNRASAAVLQRCGFVKEGRLRRHMTAQDGSRVDSLLYGLLLEEFDS